MDIIKYKPGADASLTNRKEYDFTLSSVQEEAWRLIINVLTDIFQELALHRADGQAASDMSDDPVMQSAIVLYSALKAHKFMDELIERRFERHPVMVPTFKGFWLSERASHGDIKRLEVKLSEMSNLTRNLQSKVDKKWKKPCSGVWEQGYIVKLQTPENVGIKNDPTSNSGCQDPVKVGRSSTNPSVDASMQWIFWEKNQRNICPTLKELWSSSHSWHQNSVVGNGDSLS
jgi:hypothetical protein